MRNLTARRSKWLVIVIIIGCIFLVRIPITATFLSATKLRGRNATVLRNWQQSEGDPSRSQQRDDFSINNAPAQGSNDERTNGTMVPSAFAILQFDGRDLWRREHVGPGETKYKATHWNTAAIWNWLYTKKHGHKYIFYRWEGNATKGCRSVLGEELSEPWCKVKAMLQAQNDLPGVDYFFYLDSDSVVDYRFRDQSLLDLLTNMTKWLDWDIDEKPVLFNQDGDSSWCNLVGLHNYTWCVNAGFVAWKRSRRALAVLTRWWESAGRDLESSNPLGIAFKTKWPWEQDRQEALLQNKSDPSSSHIQVAPQPEFFSMRRKNMSWCVSDLWESGCFISHFMRDSVDKVRLNQEYATYISHEQIDGSCYTKGFL